MQLPSGPARSVVHASDGPCPGSPRTPIARPVMVPSPSPPNPADEFRLFADWLTEDVAQRLYAARQDLADAALDVPSDAPELEALRDRLMLIVRSLHETAGVLRGHADGRMPVERLERLAERVESDCATAEVLMARGLSLIPRAAGAPPAALLQPLAATDTDGPSLPLPAAARRPIAGRRRHLGLA